MILSPTMFAIPRNTKLSYRFSLRTVAWNIFTIRSLSVPWIHFLSQLFSLLNLYIFDIFDISNTFGSYQTLLTNSAKSLLTFSPISSSLSTKIHKVFETNSSFLVKYRAMGKVQFLYFRRFSLVLTKFLFREDWALGNNSKTFWVFPDISYFPKILSRSVACEATRIYQIITTNHASFHLWWKENLLNHQKSLKILWTWLSSWIKFLDLNLAFLLQPQTPYCFAKYLLI